MTNLDTNESRAGDWNPTLTMLILLLPLFDGCFFGAASLFVAALLVSPRVRSKRNLYAALSPNGLCRFSLPLAHKITFNTIDNLIWKPQRSRSGGWWSENHWTIFWFAVFLLSFLASIYGNSSALLLFRVHFPAGRSPYLVSILAAALSFPFFEKWPIPPARVCGLFMGSQRPF